MLGAALLLTVALLVREWKRPRPVATPPAVPNPIEKTPEPDRLTLQPATFSELPGWSDDAVAEALPALVRSCAVLRRTAKGLAAPPSAWEGPCDALATVTPDGLRALLEARFRPWAITNHGEAEGLFTGYYEPALQGSRRRRTDFQVPLYRRPPELVAVDLGAFRTELAGERIAGRVDGTKLVPFADRAAIDAGELAGRELELLWVDDAVDAFFLQVQGSGLVELDDGTTVRVGYDGQNGHPYTSIGRVLIDRGELTREEVSMQSIRAWIGSHPDQARDLLAENASFVFFREIEGAGPLGSLGVPLTAGRSLAVDRRYLPLGPPLWLDASSPVPGGEGVAPLRRLVVAQDTGGAIRGPVRGDLFWGHGDEATDVAGRMKESGRFFILLPVAIEPPSEARAGAEP